MDIRCVDLNLLPVLDALLRHRSATLAARELNLSQSALSSALSRLRTVLGDELFVRTGRGLRPTPRASDLAAPVAEILAQVRDRVLQGGHFDPAASTRVFSLAHTDVGAYVLWPRIVRAVRQAAPGVQLRLQVPDVARLGTALAEGHVDLAIGSFPDLPQSLFQKRLFDRRYVALVAQDHRLAGAKLQLSEFAQTPQIVVRGGSGVQDLIDQFLQQHRLRREDVTELPSYLMIPPLLAGSGFLAVMPGQLADAFMTQGAFARLELPMATPVSTVRMYWHRRLQLDAGSQWLRALVSDLVASDSSD